MVMGALRADLYLMCEDLQATVAKLNGKKIPCGEIAKERWGLRTTMQLPSGGRIELYQPSHPTALGFERSEEEEETGLKSATTGTVDSY
jgi:hypothetical protein